MPTRLHSELLFALQKQPNLQQQLPFGSPSLPISALYRFVTACK
jgi:hypothetical protein